ncbi:MAG: cytochrome c peroxidase [Polyangiaceae bacterium]
MGFVRTALASLALFASACADEFIDPAGEPDDSSVAEPPPSETTGFAVGDVLPPLAFDGVDEAGARTRVALSRYALSEENSPDAPSRLLVLEVSGGLWCGTCRALAENLGDPSWSYAARFDRLEILLRGRDNGIANAHVDPAAWQREVAPGVAAVIDPDFVFSATFASPERLPLYVLVDERTLRVVDALSQPGPRELRSAIAANLDALDGLDASSNEEERLVDGLFDEVEWAMIRDMGTTPGAPPRDDTNSVADSPLAANLGRSLFFDSGLSPSGEVSCASCHDPALALSDGRARAVGAGLGPRRTPSIALAAHARYQDWDGRADSLWAQALGPLENPLEFGASRAFVVRRVLTAHLDEYRAAFPEASIPKLDLVPESGKPGDASYDALPLETRQAITEVFVRAGKSIAAFERTLRVAPSPLDRYAAGDSSALTDEEKYGLLLFFESGCAQCHWGPRLTDDAFHNTGVAASDGDLGRYAGVDAWRNSEFRADGAWSDAPNRTLESLVQRSALHIGQFKTPALRGVADSAFFGHDGSQSTLASVTEAYALRPSSHGPGDADPWLVPFGETAQWGLVPFLRVLSAPLDAPSL